MPPQNDSLLSRICNGVRNKVYELIKRCYEVNETDDSLHIRLYVPGLLKEDVEICVDHNTLTLTIKDTNETEQGLRFSAIYDLTGKPYKIHHTKGHRFSAIYDLTGKPYKIHHTKAHINDDGELNIVVPKINKKEEKNHVNVE